MSVVASHVSTDTRHSLQPTYFAGSLAMSVEPSYTVFFMLITYPGAKMKISVTNEPFWAFLAILEPSNENNVLIMFLSILARNHEEGGCFDIF